MKDIPIIFSAPMVMALLEGRKTMTRRLAWTTKRRKGSLSSIHNPTPWQKVKPGDRLYVRENFTLVGGGDPGLPIYAANWREDAKARGFDNIPDKPPKWTPCIHMPRWASRLTLVVTAVKIEKLQAISEYDATKEGATPIFGHGDEPHVIGFMRLWENLHGVEAWAANPEVVALSFRVHHCNIDRMAA